MIRWRNTHAMRRIFWMSALSWLSLGLVSLSGCMTDRANGSEIGSTPAVYQLSHANAATTPAQELPDDLGKDDVAPTPSHPLQRFYALLQALESDPDAQTIVRITQIGDSHTASDTFTGPVREELQTRFGDGGRGYLNAGKPWSSYRQRQASYSMSDGWTGGVGIRGGGQLFSLTGTRIYTDAAGEWVTRGPCKGCERGSLSQHLSIFYLQEPNGGSFDVFIDDEPAITVDTASDAEQVGVFQHDMTTDRHAIRMVSRGGGRVTLFGTSMESERGIIVDSMGINGAQLRHYLSFNEAYTKTEMSVLQPTLLILAFGANEAFSRRYRVDDPAADALELLEKLKHYHAEIVSLLDRYRSVNPDAECLVLLPPDMLDKHGDSCISYDFESDQLEGSRCVAQPPRNYAGILNAERYAAKSAGCAVWDQQYAMGGEGAIDIWRELGLAQRGGVHLRSNGYDELARAFVSDLMKNYEQWRQGQSQALNTNVIFPDLATTAREQD